MADYGRTQYGQQRPGDQAQIGGRSVSPYSSQEHRGLSTQQILTVVTLLPLGVFLLFISGGALAATMLGLAVALPVFLLFSPVLVPAALAISLAVVGFLTSGGFGIAGLSSLSWLAGYVRRLRGAFPEKAEHAGWRVQDTAGYLGQKAKEAGEAVQSKAQESGARSGTTAQEAKK